MERSENILSDDVLVGEGVALDIPSAGAAVRAGSALIDISAIGAFMFALIYWVESSEFAESMTEAQYTIYMTLLPILMMLIIPLTVETLSGGKSLGRLVFGTRVVRTDQGRSSFREALVRALIGVVEIWLTAGALALLVALVDKRSRRIGDLAAGTMVVRERIELVTPAPILMPPALQAWASRADIRRLPGGLALGVRQFLHRQMTLSEGARESLARELATDVLKYVYPGPPEGTSPTDFLMAVSAERSRREFGRLQRSENLANVLLNEKASK
ncbi:MAG: RDD family protein [Actinomycetaceae bacterium]|nr:RDD family protein [Actinomycetaceae bacterium]